MRKRIGCLFLFTLLAGFFLFENAARGIEIYTFRKERVDQEVRGNRGYIMGTPPSKPERKPRKRTLIGIDIELPTIFGEPDQEDAAGQTYAPARETYAPARESAEPARPGDRASQRAVTEERLQRDKADRQPTTVIGDSEDYWIK